MKFLIKLQTADKEIPVNYQYPLSAAIYRIIAKGDAAYAAFLHEQGYGKGFKLFTFSQLHVPFKIVGDRLKLLGGEANLQVAFHLPQAMESFVKGLFRSERVDIADKRSKARFTVTSVESLPNPLQQYRENELVCVEFKPLSPVVAGLMKEDGKYDFLAPDDPRFVESLIYNWRSKIETCYEKAGVPVADKAGTLQCNEPTDMTETVTLMEVVAMKNPPKSRLITIKADTDAETKIRGWMNFGLKVTGERRYVELLLNAGVGGV